MKKHRIQQDDTPENRNSPRARPQDQGMTKRTPPRSKRKDNLESKNHNSQHISALIGLVIVIFAIGLAIVHLGAAGAALAIPLTNLGKGFFEALQSGK